jgi:hypothetical protein
MSWSPSASVSSFFNNKAKESKEERQIVGDVLAELNRSANMISNAKQNETENVFKVSFSDNSNQKVNSNSMVVSPDILFGPAGLKTGESYYEAMDALNGRAILGTYIRKNSSQEEFNTFTNSKDELAKLAFQNSNEGKAREAIQNEWSGFTPYLDAHKELCHAKKESIVIPHGLKQSDAAGIMNVASYNLLNPTDKIKTGRSNVDNAIDEFTDMVDGSWESCIRASQYLRELLELEDSPEVPQESQGEGEQDKDDKQDGEGQGQEGDNQEGEGEDGSSGEDESDKQSSGSSSKGGESKDKKDSKGSKSQGGAGKEEGKSADGSETPNPVKVKPILGKSNIGDSSLLGGRVETLRPDLADVHGDPSDDACNIKEFKTVIDNVLIHTPATEQYAKNVYKERLVKFHQQIRQIEKCFLFQENDASIYTRGLTTGDLDDNNLWKIRFDHEHIYERKDIPKQMEHQIGILLDQSGSMGGSKMRDAADVCIMLLEGLKSYRSIKKIVYGHSGQEANYTDCIMIPYITPKMDVSYRLADAKARRQNFDGLAVKYTADKMVEVPVNGKRFMLVISDGQPAADGYGGWPAIIHTNKCIQDARKKGIKVFGIGVQNAFSSDIGDKMYGKGNYVVLTDTSSSLRVMVSKLKQFLSSN